MLRLLPFYNAVTNRFLESSIIVTMTTSDDLMTMISARFDDTNARIDSIQRSLNGLESKEHAASEIQYLTYRISSMEDNLAKLKSTLWRTVCVVSTIVAFVVTTVVSIIAMFV